MTGEKFVILLYQFPERGFTMMSAQLIGLLIEERKRQGLTQQAVADRMGVRNATFIQKIEYNRERDIKVSTVERYAEALGVKLEISIKH